MIVFASGLICSGLCGCGGAGGDTCGASASGDSGGGGGSSSSSSPSNSVRANVAGDAFNYAVTGHYSQAAGTARTPTSGTSSETFTASTLGGQPTLLDSNSLVLTINGAQMTFVDAKQLGATGVTVGQSDNGTIQAVTSGGFTLPANLTSSTALNTSESLANGTVVMIVFKVVGTASVTTPAGTFDTWQISKTMTYSDGSTSKVDFDFAPSIGAAIQAHLRNTYANGLSVSVTAALNQYTLGGS